MKHADVPFVIDFHTHITHATGGNGVLRLWDGTSTPPAVITPPGALANLCPGNTLSGELGPKALALKPAPIMSARSEFPTAPQPGAAASR